MSHLSVFRASGALKKRDLMRENQAEASGQQRTGEEDDRDEKATG
jgi:hypothetical protein